MDMINENMDGRAVTSGTSQVSPRSLTLCDEPGGSGRTRCNLPVALALKNKLWVKMAMDMMNENEDGRVHV